MNSKPDLLMSALIGFNNNYRQITQERKPTVEQPKLKNVTPPKNKFVQLEFNLEDGPHE